MLKRFFVEHWLGFLVAVGLSGLMIFPLILFPHLVSNDYQGITIASHGLDELWYLSRGREIIDGNHLGNPLLAEGKDGQDPYFTYVEYALLLPVRWLGLGTVSIPMLYAVFNGIGVFGLVLLIYWFVWQVSNNKLLSVMSAAMVIGGYAFVSPSDFFSINVYSRAFSPYVPLLFTFFYCNALLKTLLFPTWRSTVFAGIFFGVLFYVYFYAWSFVAVLTAFLLGVYLFKKNWPMARRIGVFFGTGIVLGAYSWIPLVQNFFSRSGEQLRYFHWIEYHHKPFWSVALVIATIILVLLFRREKNTDILSLFLSFIMASWVVMNQQIITGIVLQSGHYYSHFIVPIIIIIVLYGLWPWLSSIRVYRMVVTFFLFLIFMNTAIGQYRAAKTNLVTKQYWQKYRPIIDQLNKDKKPGVILAADTMDQFLFTIYTPHDLFWARGFVLANIPLERIHHALFVYMYLNKDARTDFANYIRTVMNNPTMIATYGHNPTWFYGGIYKAIEGYASGLEYFDYENQIAANQTSGVIKGKREEILPALTKEYQNIVDSSGGIASLLKKYGVRYLVWDQHKNPEWDMSFLPNKTIVAENSGIVLYAL